MSLDFPARRAVATLLRHFASGRMTNDEFESRWPRSDDAAVRVIGAAAWHLYDDIREYRLTGPDRLSFQARRAVARCVLFLHGDLPYEWPEASRAEKLAYAIAGLLTLGVATRFWKSRLDLADDADVWPFFRRTDYRRALRDARLRAHDRP